MLGSGLPELIHDDEDLARFLTQSNWYNSTSAKWRAFMPSIADNETSVYRHGIDPQESLWEIGRVAAGSRTLHGVAIVKAQVVRNEGLLVQSDEPPIRHAVLKAWPQIVSDPEMQKAKRMEIAAVIASACGQPILLQR